MEINATPYSNLKALWHTDKLMSIKNGVLSAPIYVRLKPTNVCNQHCYYCAYADSEMGLIDDIKFQDSIPWEKMQEIIQNFGEMGIKALTLSGGGEPLVYSRITDTMKLILEKNIDLSIITNGQLLGGEIAQVLSNSKWVRISFDSSNANTYAKARGISAKDFDQVCNNIKNFSKIKSKHCELGINFVINHQNSEEIYDAAKLVKELGANHIKFTARITKDLEKYHEPFKLKVINQIHKAIDELSEPGFSVINKYEYDFNSVFQRKYCKCYMKEFVTVIAADCKVYFCHDKAYTTNGVIGDLNKISFKELWFSKELQNRFKNFDATKECNHHCVYDDRNMLLNDFFMLNEDHINFI